MSLFYFEKAVIIKRTLEVPKWQRDDLRVERITKDNIDLTESFNTDAARKSFADFLDEGHVGYLCFKGDKCILRTWIFCSADRSLVGDGFFFRLKPNQAFSGWSLTTPDSRGLGVFPFTLNHAVHDLNDKDILGYINAKNEPSIRAVKKTGFEIIRNIILIRVWRFKFQVHTGPNAGFLRLKLRTGAVVD